MFNTARRSFLSSLGGVLAFFGFGATPNVSSGSVQNVSPWTADQWGWVFTTEPRDPDGFIHAKNYSISFLTLHDLGYKKGIPQTAVDVEAFAAKIQSVFDVVVTGICKPEMQDILLLTVVNPAFPAVRGYDLYPREAIESLIPMNQLRFRLTW